MFTSLAIVHVYTLSCFIHHESERMNAREDLVRAGRVAREEIVQQFPVLPVERNLHVALFDWLPVLLVKEPCQRKIVL